MNEPEWQTRKQRIDAKLRALQPVWKIMRHREGLETSTLDCVAVEEFPTANGPADYVLFVNGKLLGIIEAKKVSVGEIRPCRVEMKKPVPGSINLKRGCLRGSGRWTSTRR